MLDRLSALGIRSDAYSSLLAMSVHSPESKEVVIDVRGKEVVVSGVLTVCPCI